MKTTFKNIMIVKLRTLGDILTTFPLLRALQELYPNAKLHMVADESYRALFERHPRVHRFWGHPSQQLKAGGPGRELRHQFTMGRQMRRAGIDLFIDLYGSSRTAVWGVLGGAGKRMGFNLRGRRFFYNHIIGGECRYVVDLNLEFARALGWNGRDRALEFFASRDDEEAAQAYLAQQPAWSPAKPYAVVSPGGGWPLKLWSAERFGRVARRLRQTAGCQILISGSVAEIPLVQACGDALGGPWVPVIGLPLRQVAAVIRGARLFLGNDSGPKYFAEAYRVPTLICYGPTDYINNNPDRAENAVAVNPVACRPCHSETCRQPRRMCLDDLPEERVAEMALALWKTASA